MDIIFHIGYQKTGSSWLQRAYFPQHPDIALIANCSRPWEIEFLSYLVVTSDRDFDPGHARRLLDKEIEALDGSLAGRKVLLVSAERLSGHSATGGFDAVSIAHRINRSFPGARIVCIVRNPIEMIPSIYKQIVGEGYPGSLGDLMNQQRWRSVGFDLGQFQYHKLVNVYRDLMGSEKVCVLQYELMRNDIRTFLKQLCGFMGIEAVEPVMASKYVNKSLSDKCIPMARRMNHFRKSEWHPFPLIDLGRAHRPVLRLLLGAAERLPYAGKPVLDRPTEEYLRDYFKESNARLAELVCGEFIRY
jgi:hypothetical protein